MEFSSNNEIYIFSYLVLPFLFLHKSKIFTKSCYNHDFLSKKNTDQVKGLMILIVIVHHVSQRMVNDGLMLPFHHVGYLAVSVFLFLSGYGLMTSNQTKNNFFKNFFSKRFSRVYLPFFIVNIATILIYSTVLNDKYTVYEIIRYAMGIELIDPITWFVITIIIFYIFYYVFFSLFQNELALKLLVLFSLTYSFFCFFIGKQSYWYNISFCFPIGVYASLNIDKIFNMLSNRNYLKSLFFTIIVFSSLFLLGLFIHFLIANKVISNALRIIFENIASVLFVIILIQLLLKLELNSQIFSFLGLISYEMYLLHMKIYTLYFHYSGINVSYNIINYIILVVIISILYKKIVERMHNLLESFKISV